MRSPSPTHDLQESDTSLHSSSLSLHSVASTQAGTTSPPPNYVYYSSSVADTMGVHSPLSASPPSASPPFAYQVSNAPPGLTLPSRLPTPPPTNPWVPLSHALFLNFLNTCLDNRGMRQALIWLLNPIGHTIVRYGSIIVHRLRRGVECYAAVSAFVLRSDTEALLQMRITGWQTGRGWRRPAGDLYSYLIVPLARCAPDFSYIAWSFFKYSQPLQPHIIDIVLKVRAVLDGRPLDTLLQNDWATGWILLTNISSPAMDVLEPTVGTGLTMVMDDLHLPLRAGIVTPPATFNPCAAPPYTYCSAGERFAAGLSRNFV